MIVPKEAEAKKYKAFLCNYRAGVLENPNVGTTGDPCMDGGCSQYKFYTGNPMKNEKKCNAMIYHATNTEEMKRKYPVSDWMVGCDKNW